MCNDARERPPFRDIGSPDPEEVKPGWPELNEDVTLKVTDSEKPTNPTNPKDMAATNKIPLHLWPTTATAVGSLAFLDGAIKYGSNNWREKGVSATVYLAATARHLAAWSAGEGDDPGSGVPHLGHALACIAILIDSQAAGKLVDDREYPGGYLELLPKLEEKVNFIREKAVSRPPVKHYTRLLLTEEAAGDDPQI